MRVSIVFENCDYEALDTARELASKIYLSAEDGSDVERIAKSAVDSIADLIYFMSQQDEECPPCAGDCAECHCEDCIEDEPEAVTAEQLRAKVAEVLGGEPSGIEVVTTPTGEDLLKALAEIFGA